MRRETFEKCLTDRDRLLSRKTITHTQRREAGTIGSRHLPTKYEMADNQQQLKENLDQFFLLVKGCMIFFAGAIVYWLFGYAFAFGGDSDGIKGTGESFIGHDNFALSGLKDTQYAWWFFQFVFAATAATIVSGAIAERTEFVAYLIYSSSITGFIYPVVTHWAWSEYGWLTNVLKDDGITYQDFAGSGVVHMVGGMLAFIGAAMVGPRLGRFDNNRPTIIQGHTVPLVSLGGFILFFGFLAFNGGSQGSITNPGDGAIISLAIVNTILSGAGGAIIALVIKRVMTGIFNGNWSLLTTINGALTGMVSICAGCNVVTPWAAFVIGLVGGVVYMAWTYSMEKIKIDDPLDAVAVHYGGGLWGVIAVTLFSKDAGVLYKWNKSAFEGLGWNVVGALAISGWSAVWGVLLFGVLKAMKILRVARNIELKGLDVAKHGEPAYPTNSYGDGWNGGFHEMVGNPVVIVNSYVPNGSGNSNKETVEKQ